MMTRTANVLGHCQMTTTANDLGHCQMTMAANVLVHCQMTMTENGLVHGQWESYVSSHLEQRPSLCSFFSSCERHVHGWSAALGYANRCHSRQARSLTFPDV